MPKHAAAALDFSFMSMPEIGNGFLANLDAIREAEPVFWSAHQHGWLLTRHQDVLDGFQSKYPLSSHRLTGTVLSAIPAEERAKRVPHLTRFVPLLINNTDAPIHTRMRKLVTRAFGRKVVENIRGYVQRNIESCLDRAELSPEVEFNDAIARPITGRTIFRLLGIPEEHLDKLRGWSDTLGTSLGAVDPSVERLMEGERVLKEMFDLFETEIAKRRITPRDDVFTGLVQAIDEGDRLTLDEMVGVTVVLLIAGHDTTLNSMTLGVEALSHRADLRRALCENHEIGLAAAIELSRTTGMSAFETRVASEDFELHGASIKAGDFVYLMIAAGNRDPRVFQNPLEMDFGRNNDAVLTWGPGIHHCIGHLLAKMQLSEFFARAYRRYEQIEVVEPDLRFGAAPSFRALPVMHVRLHPRRPELSRLPLDPDGGDATQAA